MLVLFAVGVITGTFLAVGCGGSGPSGRPFYRAFVVTRPLSVVALVAGWVVTEVGRQPWVVYRVMITAAAATGARGIPVSYAALAASYLVVAGGLAWVLRRLARRWRLGGKSPAIIDDTADLDYVANYPVRGKIYNHGQTCPAVDYVAPRSQSGDHPSNWAEPT